MREAETILRGEIGVFHYAALADGQKRFIEEAIRAAQREVIKEAAELVVIDGNPEIAKQKILQLLNQIQ